MKNGRGRVNIRKLSLPIILVGLVVTWIALNRHLLWSASERRSVLPDRDRKLSASSAVVRVPAEKDLDSPAVQSAIPPLDAAELCRCRATSSGMASETSSALPQPDAVSSRSTSLVVDSKSDSETSASELTAVKFFSDSVRPILIEHCYACHGPDVQEAGIRFDERDTVFSAASSGQIPVVAGDVENSSLISRIMAADPHVRMPLNREPLTESQSRVLRLWVQNGAPWPTEQDHWAFRRLESRIPPESANPAWCANEIDQFILAALEREGFQPSPEADRTTLIRRAYLDLLGLPPSPAEVDEFLSDTRPEAWEGLIDRLLASPHYGEKWAIRWLDLARFADSDGFELDEVRTMWLYRDWLIDALNRDLPFDQFTFEQLAGDLIPNATPEQIMATGFLRSSAVAPDIRQNRYEMIVDRVNTVGTVWLGLTLGCAQCHNHKFDPISQTEFFQLYAVFNRGIEECEGPRYVGKILSATSPLNGTVGDTLVMADRRKDFLPTHLKIRGAFDADGEAVNPGVPAAFHQPRSEITDRISLACWIIDDANPLTARVAVNRIWESLFGIGIVRTSEDFGLRGERPSHPELLDWLAIEFRRSGWSMKSMIRVIMMSSAYRQSAVVSEENYDRDPENRLMARGARFRVDAEIVRDVALRAAGLLSEKLGGPSVFPAQPPGISEKREFGAFTWKQSTAEDQFRRGIYTHWKRTAVYPGFSIFDAPTRMLACSRRAQSSNPLQALTMMNDPVYVEAAVHLGRMMLQEGQNDVRSELICGFRRCVARFPNEAELQQLQSLYEDEISRFEKDPPSAVIQLGGDSVIGQYPSMEKTRWAALSTVASVLLNLDETITKE